MALFKCKMCGGSLEINDETVVTCEYCGTQQTLPKLDDDKRVNMYDRANHFRRNNEFDKAMGIYEQILNEDNTDAEAYWSLVLCRYGIEYVEDPSSRKRVPTVNRAQFTSVFDDEDYKSAIKYADAHQKELYEKEATAINEIQKGILAISGQEEPFDVFICYKETDANGRRTQDSVLATELYHELTCEGYKVFFSRITLEDKLGTAYEPYIFAALNSSKVMVVLGTRPEYFNAVWVKNEWSRYLALIKQGQKKMLIPAYKDMDPYDLPEEFSHLQAQDMSKLGFMQDLVRGITKLVSVDNASTIKETVVVESSASGNVNIAPLLRRAFMFLEDGNIKSASEYCEKVLDISPECADAYLVKLMVECSVINKGELKDCKEPFDNSLNYQKILRFGDGSLVNELKGYLTCIKERNEIERLEGIRVQEERKRIEHKRQIELERIAREKARKRNIKLAIITPIVSLLITFVIILNTVIIPHTKYNEAVALMNDGKYNEAIERFAELEDYKDSIKLLSYSLRAKSYSLRAKFIECDKFIFAGSFHTVGLRPDGTVVAVGENDYGQCNVSGWRDIVAISAARSHTVGLKSDGTVVATEYIGDKKYYYNQCEVSDWMDIVAISGSDHTVGLKSDGTVVATKCSLNYYSGQCDVSDWTDIVAISAGSDHTVGLKSDGTVVAVGDNDNGQCNISDWTDIVEISAGGNHTVGLKLDGTVIAVGGNYDGQCEVSDWQDIVAISAGYSHTVGLKSDGTVVAVGYNNDGKCEVSDWTDIVAISAGSGHTVGLKSDGTVVATKYSGNYYFGQCKVEKWDLID